MQKGNIIKYVATGLVLATIATTGLKIHDKM